MALQRKHVAALYVEDLIDFFMKKYEINWKPPYELTKNLQGTPKVFTEAIGETVFATSQYYQYRRIAEIEVSKHLANEAAFYNCVFGTGKELLKRPSETSFFHMSAYAAEVAVFCEIRSCQYLHASLNSAIMCVCDDNIDLNAQITRLYYQEMAKNLNHSKTQRTLNENEEESAKAIPGTENNDSSANMDQGASSSSKDDSVKKMDSQLHHSETASSSNHPRPSFVFPNYSNSFSSSQHAPTLPPSFPFGHVPEMGIPMYPMFHDSQFDPPPLPSVPMAPSWQQNIHNYYRQHYAPGPYMASGSAFNDYNVMQFPPMFGLPAASPQILNTFSLNNPGYFTRPAKPKNSNAQPKQKSQPFNIDTLELMHPSKKRKIKGSSSAASTSEAEGQENMITSSNKSPSKDCK